MKTTIAAVFIIALFATTAIADKAKTVDEVVQVLKTKWLQAKDRDWILRNTKDEVRSRLYMGFGTGMRNQFGLWETISRFMTRAVRKSRRAVLL